MPLSLRLVLTAPIAPLIAACPFGGNSTICTGSVATALRSTSGSASPTDAGTLITLDWPTPERPSELDYFQRAQIRAHGDAEVKRFNVVSASRAEAEFFPLDGGFSFAVIFPEPDRVGVAGCDGRHGGMDDTIELKVEVSAPSDGGLRAISTTADINMGAL